MTTSVSVIEARLTKPSLTFTPGGAPASFGVEVINHSGKFAAFQLEILAAGARRESDWYQLMPKRHVRKFANGSMSGFGEG